MVICKIYQNNTLKFSSENIILNSFSLNRFSSSAVAPEFGNVSAGELLFTIDTSTTQNTVERGDLLTVEFDDTYSIGEFIVTSVAKRQGAFDVTCLDRMIELDGKANLSGVTFPLTASAFINQIYGTGFGMTVDISANVHNPTIDDPLFEDGITYRQVLSKVCECMGANAWYTDKLNIGWYEDSEITYTSAEYFSADLTEKGFDVAVEVTDDVTATPVEIKDNGITLRIVANPFFANKTSTERTAIATAIKQNIGTVSWYGGNAVVIPELPYLLPNSIVEIDGKAFPVTSVTHGINENIKLESKIQSDDNAYNYDVARDIAKVKKEVGELEENNKHFFYRDDSGVHITMVENDYNTGNNIHIDSDSVDVRQGTETTASFGFPTRLGSEESNKIVLDDEALKIQDMANRTLFEVGARIENAVIDTDDTVQGLGNTYEGYATFNVFGSSVLGVISVTLGEQYEDRFEPISQLFDYTYTITGDYLYIYSDKITSSVEVEVRYLESGEVVGNLIYGENNIANGNKNVVIGDNVTADGDGQIIVGQYNDSTDTTSKIVIADGEYDSVLEEIHPNNALTVGFDGSDIQIRTNSREEGGGASPTGRSIKIIGNKNIDIVAEGYDDSGTWIGGEVSINGEVVSPYQSTRNGETIRLQSITGSGYSTGTSGTYYFFLDTPRKVPSGKTLTVQSATATIRGGNGLVGSNVDITNNINNMIRGNSGNPRLYITGLTNSFKANSPAHIVVTIEFEIG